MFLVNDISSKRQDKLNEINQNYQKRLDEKLKKVHESTETIKKMEQQKLKERESKKIEKFGVYNSQIQKQKQDIEEKRSKEKKKFEHVRENYEEMLKDYESQKQELSVKIRTKKQSRLKEIVNGRMNAYLNKRQSSYDKFLENYSSIKKMNSRRNLKLMRVQQIKNRRSFEKAKSMEISKDNTRLIISFFISVSFSIFFFCL